MSSWEREGGILSKYVIPLCKTLQWLPIFLKVKAQVSSGAPTTYLTSQPISHLRLLTVPQLCWSPSQCGAFAFRYSLPGEFFPSKLPGSLTTHFLLVYALSPYQKSFSTTLSKTASPVTLYYVSFFFITFIHLTYVCFVIYSLLSHSH